MRRTLPASTLEPAFLRALAALRLMTSLDGVGPVGFFADAISNSFTKDWIVKPFRPGNSASSSRSLRSCSALASRARRASNSAASSELQATTRWTGKSRDSSSFPWISSRRTKSKASILSPIRPSTCVVPRFCPCPPLFSHPWSARHKKGVDDAQALVQRHAVLHIL
jgi:hypothetical protein